MTTGPTAEQKAAREQLAEARRKTRERKARDRRLYRIGTVMDAHGYDDPADVEELLRTIDGALAPSEPPRAEGYAPDAQEYAPEIAPEHDAGDRAASPIPPATPTPAPRALLAACALALLGPTLWGLSRRRRGGAGWTR